MVLRIVVTIICHSNSPRYASLLVSHKCTQNSSFFVYTKTLLDLQCGQPDAKAVRLRLCNELQLLDKCMIQ